MLREILEPDSLLGGPFVFSDDCCHVILHEYSACLTVSAAEGHLLGQALLEAIGNDCDVMSGPWTIERWNDEDNPSDLYILIDHDGIYEHRLKVLDACDLAEDYWEVFLDDDPILDDSERSRYEAMYDEVKKRRPHFEVHMAQRQHNTEKYGRRSKAVKDIAHYRQAVLAWAKEAKAKTEEGWKALDEFARHLQALRLDPAKTDLWPVLRYASCEHAEGALTKKWKRFEELVMVPKDQDEDSSEDVEE